LNWLDYGIMPGGTFAVCVSHKHACVLVVLTFRPIPDPVAGPEKIRLAVRWLPCGVYWLVIVRHIVICLAIPDMSVSSGFLPVANIAVRMGVLPAWTVQDDFVVAAF
jgi:hypothetical protein